MRLFLTGANGFIGSSVALALLADGHTVRGLVRDDSKAEAVRALGVVPVVGTLDDAELLQREAAAADGVVNAASSDHRAAVEALLAGLAGSDKPFLHTSGSSCVSEPSDGQPSERIYHEGDAIVPDAARAHRVAIDRLVLDAPGVRSAVLCCSLIYGHAALASAESVQLPTLLHQAERSGVVRYIGRGLNRWSTVHVDDVAALYALALRSVLAHTFLYVESGEASFGEMAQSLATRCGLGAAQSWTLDEASRVWPRGMAQYALGSNSRVRGRAGVELLEWQPKRRSVCEWIETEMAVPNLYRLTYFPSQGKAEVSRLLFALARQPYVDERLSETVGAASRPAFDRLQPSLPFGQLPVLRLGGATGPLLAQSKSIERFLARRFGLLGADEVQAQQADSVTEAVRDLIDAYRASRATDDAKQRFLAHTLPTFVRQLDGLAQRCSTSANTLVGSTLTLADVVVYHVFSLPIPEQAAMRAAVAQYPLVEAAIAHVADRPEIREWVAKRPA